MKRKIIMAAISAVVAFVAGYGVYASQQSSGMSDLALANVEALADDEENPFCPNGCVNDGNGCYCYHWFPTYRESIQNE